MFYFSFYQSMFAVHNDYVNRAESGHARNILIRFLSPFRVPPHVSFIAFAKDLSPCFLVLFTLRFIYILGFCMFLLS